MVRQKNFPLALGILHENDVHVFLVSRDGTVLWQMQGEFSPEKGEELVQVIKDRVLPDLSGRVASAYQAKRLMPERDMS